MCGVGYHHAGVTVSDRKLVEDAFTVGDLPVLCKYSLPFCIGFSSRPPTIYFTFVSTYQVDDDTYLNILIVLQYLHHITAQLTS